MNSINQSAPDAPSVRTKRSPRARRLLLKLRRMTFREGCVRGREWISTLGERRRYGRGRRVRHQTPPHLHRNLQALLPGSRDVAELTRRFPHIADMLRRQSVETAGQIVAGQYELLGVPLNLGKEIHWHKDPRGVYEFPRRFFHDVRIYELPEGVDVKHVWELGRHQYLPQLAFGWAFTHDEQYLNTIRRVLLDWIQQNPQFEGVHWTSALEVAVRLISWIWTLAILPWESWSDDEQQRIYTAIVEHGEYLENHLSYYSSPYNHLIGEATGLVLAGTLCQPESFASRWKSLGLRVLRHYGPQQFYGDGFCVEQATGYHHFTLGFLTLAIQAARVVGKDVAELERVALAAYHAGKAFRQPGGRWPQFGDIDSARAMPVAHDDFWDFSSLYALAAAMFDDGQLKLPETGYEELFWLQGCSGVQRFEEMSVGLARSCHVLPEAGYAIAGEAADAEGDWLLFDAGPIAAGLHADAMPSAAHGHADTLQVLYCQDGRPLLVDAGMPQYAGSPRGRSFSRGGRAQYSGNLRSCRGADGRAAGLGP
jgi:hypothetical protein